MRGFERVVLIAVTSTLVLRLALMVWVPLADTSEPRYAEIARLMALSGDWITPWFEPGVPFWGKPPLAFWAAALNFRLLGVGEFAARLPSWLITLATLGLVHALAKRMFHVGVARVACLIYATSLLPFVTAGAVLTDAWLTLAVTWALAAFAMAPNEPRPLWRYGFFLALAVGILAKGPLAVVFVVVVAVPWVVWHRGWARYVRAFPWVTGAFMTLALTLPWYVAAEVRTPGFLQYFLVGEHVSRFLDPGWQGDQYGTAHQRAYGAIWLDWLLATFPWGLIFLPVIWRRRASWRSVQERLGRDGDPRWTLLLLWSVAAPVLFTFSGNILWTYVLPSLPAFAILAASAFAGNPSAVRQPARKWVLLPSLVPAAALVLAGAVLAEPNFLKSERGLVAYHQSHAAGQPLYYLEERPFSARFYSHGRVGLVNRADLEPLRQREPDGVFLAVPKGELGGLSIPQPVRTLMENRRYTLVFLPGGYGQRHKSPLAAPPASINTQPQ